MGDVDPAMTGSTMTCEQSTHLSRRMFCRTVRCPTWAASPVIEIARVILRSQSFLLHHSKGQNQDQNQGHRSAMRLPSFCHALCYPFAMPSATDRRPLHRLAAPALPALLLASRFTLAWALTSAADRFHSA